MAKKKNKNKQKGTKKKGRGGDNSPGVGKDEFSENDSHPEVHFLQRVAFHPHSRRGVKRDLSSMNISLIIIVVIMLMAIFYFLGPLLQPLFVAVFLFFLINPMVNQMAEHNVPKWIGYLTLVLLFVGMITVLGVVVYNNVEAFKNKAPEYQVRLEHLADDLAVRFGYADKQGRFDWNQYSLGEFLTISYSAVAEYVFGTLYGFLTNLLVVLFYLIFIILEAQKLPNRIQKAFPGTMGERILEVSRNIDEGIKKYMVVKTLISLGTGGTAAFVLFMYDQDHWILWGMLTFLFNYIPYIGSIFVSLFPITIALLASDTLWIPGTIAVLLFANQSFWGNFLEPKVSGSELNISPLFLLIIVAYWGWIWGVTGMILSVPFAVAIKIILANIEKTKPLAILLSNE